MEQPCWQLTVDISAPVAKNSTWWSFPISSCRMRYPQPMEAAQPQPLPSGMDILGFEIKDQTAAVLVYGGDIDLLLSQKLVKQLGAYLA